MFINTFQHSYSYLQKLSAGKGFVKTYGTEFFRRTAHGIMHEGRIGFEPLFTVITTFVVNRFEDSGPIKTRSTVISFIGIGKMKCHPQSVVSYACFFHNENIVLGFVMRHKINNFVWDIARI